MSKELIIYKLANKYNLPLSKIKEIVDSQFKYVAKVIKQGEYETVRLPYFGKFSVNKGRLKYLTKNKNENNKM